MPGKVDPVWRGRGAPDVLSLRRICGLPPQAESDGETGRRDRTGRSDRTVCRCLTAGLRVRCRWRGQMNRLATVIWIVAAIVLSTSNASDAPEPGPSETQGEGGMQHTLDSGADEDGASSEWLESRQGVDDWTPSQVSDPCFRRGGRKGGRWRGQRETAQACPFPPGVSDASVLRGSRSRTGCKRKASRHGVTKSTWPRWKIMT